jgi:hypothetical protein
MRLIRLFLKYLLMTFLIALTGVLLLFVYFNLPGPAPRKDVSLGMTFSSKYAEGLGLDWKETYRALLDEVGVRKLRLPVYWDITEPQQGVYDFSSLDWQLTEATSRGAQVILSVGQKVPRWPECHIPQWVGEDASVRHKALLGFIEKTVERYKDNPTITTWQVENEPFLNFGICPDFDVSFLEEEVALVKKLDPTRPVLLTDSGELSLWYGAASRGDEFGTTLYRDIYSKHVGGYFTYPIGPNFFRFKAWMARTFAHQKNLMVIELQAEPWASGWLTGVPLEEQFYTMNEVKLRENVDYARRVGFKDIYLWGGEWWYWLKVKEHYPAVWETGKQLFREYGS